MKCNTCFLAVLAASTVLACQHDFHHHEQFAGLQSRLEKRQAPAFPPALDAAEALLTGSFDNTSIESWSYFYTHGLHWAGTNKSMAQWTIDRWAESGFDTKLAEYRRCRKALDPVRSMMANSLRHLFKLPSVKICDHDAFEWVCVYPKPY